LAGILFCFSMISACGGGGDKPDSGLDAQDGFDAGPTDDGASIQDDGGTLADDGGVTDQEIQDGGDSGPGPGRATGYTVTSGGGRAASSHFKAAISVGAPQPSGKTAGSGKVLQVGPRP
jgi:hypothetical protein